MTREETIIVHLTCTLLDLARSVRLCQESGLIPVRKEYRMTVSSAGRSVESLNLFSGDNRRGLRAFAVFEFGGGPGQLADEAARERFVSLCSEKEITEN